MIICSEQVLDSAVMYWPLRYFSGCWLNGDGESFEKFQDKFAPVFYSGSCGQEKEATTRQNQLLEFIIPAIKSYHEVYRNHHLSSPFGVRHHECSCSTG
jgi:hypothetical protein